MKYDIHTVEHRVIQKTKQSLVPEDDRRQIIWEEYLKKGAPDTLSYCDELSILSKIFEAERYYTMALSVPPSTYRKKAKELRKTSVYDTEVILFANLNDNRLSNCLDAELYRALAEALSQGDQVVIEYFNPESQGFLSIRNTASLVNLSKTEVGRRIAAVTQCLKAVGKLMAMNSVNRLRLEEWIKLKRGKSING